jgi:hypothetical protein
VRKKIRLKSIGFIINDEFDCFKMRHFFTWVDKFILIMSGTIIRGTLKTPNSQLVTLISIKLQRPDGCD